VLRRGLISYLPANAVQGLVAAYVGVITSALPLSFSYAALPTTK
jgi:hypothetical protein